MYIWPFINKIKLIKWSMMIDDQYSLHNNYLECKYTTLCCNYYYNMTCDIKLKLFKAVSGNISESNCNYKALCHILLL